MRKISLIHLRRRNAIKAGLIGAGIAAIPLLLVILVLLICYPDIYGVLYGKEEKQQKEVWYLKHDAAAEAVITQEDIVKRKQDAEGLPGNILSGEKLLGKRLKVSLAGNTMLTEDMVYEGEGLTDDERIHYFNFIESSGVLKKGDYIDVRIVFPNGADFVLLSKKKLENTRLLAGSDGTQAQSELWFQVNETEILRLSSALVDMYLTEGCRIYAIQYILDSQEKAQVNYPVNEVVNQLMEKDPNIVERAKQAAEDKLRKLLEEGQQKEEPMYTESEEDLESCGEDSIYDLPAYESPVYDAQEKEFQEAQEREYFSP